MDEMLSITGRPVSRMPKTSQREWLGLWNGIYPLMVLPRYVQRHDWAGAAFCLITFACLLATVHFRPAVDPRSGLQKVLVIAVLGLAGALVLAAQTPALRATGLVLTPVAFLINFALVRQASGDGGDDDSTRSNGDTVTNGFTT